MKISLIYGKRVESTSGRTGYVVSVNAEGNRIVSLVCADCNEKRFTVDFKNIKRIKAKIIFDDKKSECKSNSAVRLGKPVFDCDGTYIGKLTDFTIEKDLITYAHVGNKKFSAEDVICGDAVIIKSSARILKSDVKKNGKVLIRRGTPLTPETAVKAKKQGEYVQANLKTI